MGLVQINLGCNMQLLLSTQDLTIDNNHLLCLVCFIYTYRFSLIASGWSCSMGMIIILWWRWALPHVRFDMGVCSRLIFVTSYSSECAILIRSWSQNVYHNTVQLTSTWRWSTPIWTSINLGPERIPMKQVMKKSVHAFLALPSEVFIVLEMEFGKTFTLEPQNITPIKSSKISFTKVTQQY